MPISWGLDPTAGVTFPNVASGFQSRYVTGGGSINPSVTLQGATIAMLKRRGLAIKLFLESAFIELDNEDILVSIEDIRASIEDIRASMDVILVARFPTETLKSTISAVNSERVLNQNIPCNSCAQGGAASNPAARVTSICF